MLKTNTMKIHCITWKEERWSADKETLESINKMINKDKVKKRTLLNILNPESILLFFIYILGFIYYGAVSLVKWLVKKLKRNK